MKKKVRKNETERAREDENIERCQKKEREYKSERY